VQVDPIKPALTAPGTKLLKLNHDEVLSSFAFSFNMRRYSKEQVERDRDAYVARRRQEMRQVGW